LKCLLTVLYLPLTLEISNALTALGVIVHSVYCGDYSIHVIRDLPIFLQGWCHSHLCLLGIGWQVAVCRVTMYQRCSFHSRARENPWDPWRGVQHGVHPDLASPCLAFQLRRHFSPIPINPSRCHHRNNNNNNNNNYKSLICRKFDNTTKTTHPLWPLDHSRNDRKK
jgi:hypothetical protein